MDPLEEGEECQKVAMIGLESKQNEQHSGAAHLLLLPLASAHSAPFDGAHFGNSLLGNGQIEGHFQAQFPFGGHPFPPAAQFFVDGLTAEHAPPTVGIGAAYFGVPNAQESVENDGPLNSAADSMGPLTCSSQNEGSRMEEEGPRKRTGPNGGELMVAICRGCGLEIRDSHLMSLSRRKEKREEMEENGPKGDEIWGPENGNGAEGNEFWHENCLRCVECGCKLGDAEMDGGGNGTCFLRNGRAYCREDHGKLFDVGDVGPKPSCLHHRPPQCCSRCALPIGPQELVFRSAHSHVFHLHCFQCSCCGHPLAKGDQYLCSAEGGHLICQRDFGIWQLQQQLAAVGVGGGTTIGRGNLPNDQPHHFLSIPAFPELDFSLQRPNFHHHHHSDRSKKVPKRPRTILNAPQRKAFKLAFEKGPKPSRKVREQLARETGLSVRVVQVWFQNQRAKMKKERKREMDKQQQIGGNGFTPMSTGGCTDSDGGGGRDEVDQHFSQMKSPQSGTTDDSDIDGDEEADEESAGSCNSSAIGFMGTTSMGANMEGIGGMDGEICQIGGSQLQNEGMSSIPAQPNPIEKLYNMHQNYFAFV